MAPRPAADAAAAPKKKGGMKQGSLFSFFSKKETKAPIASQPQKAAPPLSAPPPSVKPSAFAAHNNINQPPPSQNQELLAQIQIGVKIEVYWSEDDTWYGAKVTKHRVGGNYYYLEYDDDGQCEWIDLSAEPFRFLVKKKKRHIQQDDQEEEDSEDEAEFEMPASDDEESAYKEDGKAKDEEEDDDDQWMVTDDEDDLEIAKRAKKPKQNPAKKLKTSIASADPMKTSSAAHKKPSSRPCSTSGSTSLNKFAQVTVTEHSGKTPRISSTPKQITPGLVTFSQPSPPAEATKTPSLQKKKQAPPPAFEVGALNPAGSHVHNHLLFLQNPVDAQGRSPRDPDYDPRTLKLQERDWSKVTGKQMTDAVKQWWDLKSMYFDTVLLFKTGKFYEMFHMDADIGVQVCGLCYMKGHVAHAGFPEISYGIMADKLVRAGYKVARVEQTETPEQLNIRKKTCARGNAPKVVNREVCSILTLGTRTFCYLDDESGILDEATGGNAPVGPLLAIREILVGDPSVVINDDENVQPVCEYGITLVDAVRGSVTIGQFADDVLRSRLVTLLTAFPPSEILLEGGEDGASPTLLSLIRSFQTTAQQSFRVETILPNESFPQSTAIDPHIRKQLERGAGGRQNKVQPWDVQETLEELHRRKYYPRASKLQADRSVARWPKVLRAAVEGNAKLALASFGAALFYLQRNLIDAELLSMGIVKAYIPPESSASSHDAVGEIQQLAVEQNMQESGIGDAVRGDVPDLMQIDYPTSLDAENEITHMSLDGTTLHNLEILTNAVDHKTTGSLWSKINYTKTPHGSRLLRAWLLRPLFRKVDIERRQDAVEELVSGGAAVALKEARAVLAKCGDIERLLSRIHSMSGCGMPWDDDESDRFHPNDRAVLYETATYTKRKVGDFSRVLNGLQCASQIPELFKGIEIESGLLRKIVHFTDQGGCFPNLAEDLEWFFGNFDCDQAAKGLYEPSKGIDELYDEACDAIDRIVAELNDYKDEMCSNFLKPRALAKSSWKYVNVKPESKDKYLIELPANVAVPDDFIMKGKRGSGHKQVNKYRTRDVEQLVEEMEKAYDIQKKRKAKGMELIFAKFDSKRSIWAAIAQATALLDALGALAQTASKSGYTRPRILDCPPNKSPSIIVLQGRHPCVENTFNSAEFVPNDLTLGCSSASAVGTSPRVLLLSGPNMGGKSTLLRQTCLIAILAQLGSFVPAADCELTPVDRIFTRLGASDRILLNQSTFFVELAETAQALRGASRRSLVIMDELGRGTSTFDGTAIASAAVQHLVERSKCLSLFATHYHSLLDEWKENKSVVLGHMECLVEDNQEETEPEDSKITFLYTLGNGVCPKSFGINVARLAGLPEDVLVKAKRISAEFELEMSSAEGSRSLVTSLSAVLQKRAIAEAIREGSWDAVASIWQGLQE